LSFDVYYLLIVDQVEVLSGEFCRLWYYTSLRDSISSLTRTNRLGDVNFRLKSIYCTHSPRTSFLYTIGIYVPHMPADTLNWVDLISRAYFKSKISQ